MLEFWVGAGCGSLVVFFTMCGYGSYRYRSGRGEGFTTGIREGERTIRVEAVRRGSAKWEPNHDGTTNFRWVAVNVPESEQSS